MARVIVMSEEQAPLPSEGASGYLTIDLAALARNYAKLSSILAPARAGAVVKADAYGLGAGRVAPALYRAGCRHFFVAQFAEAVRLRPLLAADAQVFVLNGLQPGNEGPCAEGGIIPVLNSLEQWRSWRATAKRLNRRLPAVLQFDTGMSRLGVSPEERGTLAVELAGKGNVEVLFIMSHLASADELDSDQNDDQLAQMQRIAEELPGLEICFANSGGILLGTSYHGVLARPGIALYGGTPTTPGANQMEAVVRLDVAVVQTRTVPAGAKVGYSGTHIADSETRLATIAAGYADGLPRSLSGRGAVYYRGTRLPIVGRVSMDSITVNITALPEGTLRLGSLVEVLGLHQTLEDVARDAGTISYEILTSLGDRYHRQYR
ncbi:MULTISPECIES: alanine racemase [Rhizobium]|uniref:Alanine racemase n=1 Tax=Rhizobium binae TaxID=1138190 RepID=A0ABV2ML51_9HYPH|nr:MULTISPECIES: alanine racemase [Rhizobium]NKL49667.1 alanine racemase [Rhizobium leguminosarum bv. viciae]MBX4936991.1 alanine racemase [Rhizobium binae]MBX4943641.1 alanine racemase [Rhizobium binae]MBX4979085.1 alanine racemase [Rhizobium binae]MBX4995822.1 alanine racemase [Rhizobium binae]